MQHLNVFLFFASNMHTNPLYSKRTSILTDFFIVKLFQFLLNSIRTFLKHLFRVSKFTCFFLVLMTISFIELFAFFNLQSCSNCFLTYPMYSFILTVPLSLPMPSVKYFEYFWYLKVSWEIRETFWETLYIL